MAVVTVPEVPLPSGDSLPKLGVGTWHVAEDPTRRAGEIAALREAVRLGMSLIDTAEMYGDGAAEALVGEAIAGHRDEVFLVSKVMPHHATYEGTIAACTASLRRLRTDHLDLYLLHWPGRVPLAETVRAFAALEAAGRIRHWGVSNFDLAHMRQLVDLVGPQAVGNNQVLYNLVRRGIEFDLLPWHLRVGIPVTAYAPLEQGRLLHHPVVRAVADRHRATPAQVCIAWVLRHDGVTTIPRASTPGRVLENVAGLSLRLEAEDLRALDRAFPPPTSPQPLDVL